ncbi:MAG TPA: DUF5069 domain-containing protein [Pyrinomonadaceae bacterium]|nr:DUF5069 domain-containing protein [Pyrinomonadaceae bacterium]
MTPLDLTKAPPRSPQAELHGLCMLPRIIDIARAMLCGGNVGEYQIGRGVSGAVFRAFGVSTAQFVDIVRDASSEDDVAQRLWSVRALPAEALSRRLRNLTVADVPDDVRPEFERFYGTGQPSDRLVFDILEADDAQAFTENA